MKTIRIFRCDFCGRDYKTPTEAYECEAKCLNLTFDEYMKYLDLLLEEKMAFGQASCTMNSEVRERCDKAIREVIEFQEKYGITDNR